MSVERHKHSWLMIALEVLFVLFALFAGFWTASAGFKAFVIILVSLLAFLGVRLLLRRPFHEALALFVGLSAFNFYYFYCARLTGRNPTDVGTWGIPATNLEKLMKDFVLFALLGLAGFKLIHQRLENRPLWSRRLNHPMVWLILLFMAYSVIRGITWVFQGEDMYDLLYYIRGNMEYAVIPLVLITILVREESQLSLICRGMVYSLPIVSILGIVEFFLQGSPFVRTFGGGHYFYRATSTLQNPNNLGGYLVTVLGVGMVYFLAKKYNAWERWGFKLTIPLALACLFMTLSRSSLMFMVATAVICLVLRWIAHRRSLPEGYVIINMKWVIWSALILLGGLYVLFNYFDFLHAFQDAANQYLDPTSSVAGYRIFAPFFTLKTMLANPLKILFGITWKEVNFGPDNAFGYILLRNGLLGFVMYAAIWGIALWTCIRRVLWRYSHYLYWVCTYILVFQFLYGFSAPIHENFPHNLYFWLAIGVLIWLESEPVEEVEQQSQLEQLMQHLMAYLPNSQAEQ